MKYNLHIDTATISEFTSPTHEKAIAKAEKILKQETLAKYGHKAKLMWVYRCGRSLVKEWGENKLKELCGN